MSARGGEARQAVSPTADALADLLNFRDAGLATPSGRMRTGVLFRSSRLSGLDDAAGAALVASGVTDVFDLRTAEEVEHRPDRLPPSINLTVANVLADRPHGGAVAVATLARSRMDPEAIEAINEAVGDGRARELMLQTYRDFAGLPSALRGFALVLGGVARAPGASIVHCTAGKDRSGWAVALMQLVCGVPTEDVVADYQRSNQAMSDAYGPLLEQFADAGGDARSLASILYVDPDYLEAGLAAAGSAFGDLDGYLTAGLGLTTFDVDRLRARLLA